MAICPPSTLWIKKVINEKVFCSIVGVVHYKKLMDELKERIDGSDKAEYNHSASTEMNIVKVLNILAY